MISNNKEYWSLVLTMIVGGLVYSIASMAYLYQTFETKETVIKQSIRVDRIEDRVSRQLEVINQKIDYLIREKQNN